MATAFKTFYSQCIDIGLHRVIFVHVSDKSRSLFSRLADHSLPNIIRRQRFQDKT